MENERQDLRKRQAATVRNPDGFALKSGGADFLTAFDD